MQGVSKIRAQGYGDPLLVRLMKERGYEEVPLYKYRPPDQDAQRREWAALACVRDGPVNSQRREIDDAHAASREIKRRAVVLGADAVGIARLTPIMVREGVDLPHDHVICMIVAEDYARALEGPRAIEQEASDAYVRCAELSTKIAQYIRSWGYPALAHHNGACDIQAIPAMIAAGLGELGKHGSLIHPKFGASHRPGMVTTSMPLSPDAPLGFGVQETCLHCNLCSNNCPGDAIPEEYVLTDGIRRWLTDVERCYVYSRLRAEYCHICMDVCPFVHKANGDRNKKALYKRYMAERKRAGYKTPTWFPEDGPAEAD